MKRILAAVALALYLLTAGAAALAQASGPNGLHANGMKLFSADPATVSGALDWFSERGDPDAAAAIILAMRFSLLGPQLYDAALRDITAEPDLSGWPDWAKWLERNPQIVPFDGFQRIHADVHTRLDPNFQVFLRPGIAHEIRIEEIVWGGVKKDGIPALTYPALIPADDADYLGDGDFVFGVEINGDARAYPLRILNWHEMFNDIIGGIPVSLAYCTLCGSGILYETSIDGFPEPLIFGSSGFLFRSNKLMYDTYTNSLWNQFTGRPVVGPLTGSGIELKTRPVVVSTWESWRQAHPDTQVLDLNTGYARDYDEGASYADYFASPDLMFPTNVDQSKLKQKDLVFVLRGAPTEMSWPLSRFAGGAVINDRAGVMQIVLVGDAATRTVRAYETGGQPFVKSGDPARIMLDGATWDVTEDALLGPGGERLERLPGHIAYWFAWDGYYGDEGELALN